MYPRSMDDSDCVVVMGSNMAENHPVAFRWPMKAKVEHGAKLIHVDPRFTRTSAVADIYAPMRAGSDIAFLGGLINYVLEQRALEQRSVLPHLGRRPTPTPRRIISEEFRDTEDLDGVFSGLMEYTGGVPEWPFNGFTERVRRRDLAVRAARGSATRAGSASHGAVRRDAEARRSGDAGGAGSGRAGARRTTTLVQVAAERRRRSATRRCSTRAACSRSCKRHFSRYTPEMVERATGCPRDTFLRVARDHPRELGRRAHDRRSPTPWPGRSTPTACRSSAACALLQLLLGNIGRPGAGIMALRGHASIQGSTDIPTLYHSIHGYMPHPTALKTHDTLARLPRRRDAADRLLGRTRRSSWCRT